MPQELETDHRDGNGLDNRRQNLRIATHAQNQHNARRHSHGRSRFKGVYFKKTHKKWASVIWGSGKRKHLGYFTTEEEAARAYDAAALQHYGAFARLNQPSA